MYKNKENDDWILCSSKSAPGKYYYFNVRNGEAVWTHEAEITPDENPSSFQKIFEQNIYPEPKKPPDNVNYTNHAPNIDQTFQNINTTNTPIFNPTMLSRYVANEFSPNLIWVPIFIPPIFSQEPVKHEFEKGISVHSLPIPLTKRFKNYKNPKLNYHINVEKCSPKLVITSTPLGKKVNTFNITRNSSNDISKTTQTDTEFSPNPPLFDISIKSHESGILFSYNDRLKRTASMCKPRFKIDECTQTPKRKNSPVGNIDESNIIQKPQNPGSNTSRNPQETHGVPKISELTEIFKTSLDIRYPKNVQRVYSIPKVSKQSQTVQANLESEYPTLIKKVDNITEECEELQIFKPNLGSNNLSCTQNVDSIPKICDKLKNSEPKDMSIPKVSKEQTQLSIFDLDNHNKDLRLLLNERKHSKSQTSKGNVNNTKNEEPLSRKKRVTFDDDQNKCDTVDEIPADIPEGNDTNNQFYHLSNLRSSTSNLNTCYILADMDMIFENLDLILDFVKTGNQNRLFIPRSMSETIESISLGDSRGRQHVVVARKLYRLIISTSSLVVVQNFEMLDGVSEDTNYYILSCCLYLQRLEYRVILISNDATIQNRAKSHQIPCFTSHEITKRVISAKPEVGFELHKIDKPDSHNDLLLNSLREYNSNFLYKEQTYIQTDATRIRKSSSTSIDNKKIVLDDKKTEIKISFCNDNCNKNQNGIDRKQYVIDKNQQGTNIANLKRKDIIDGTKEDNIIATKNDVQTNVKNTFNVVTNQEIINSSFKIPKLTESNSKLKTWSLDENLMRFFIDDKEVDEKISTRIDEYMCTLTQIMEDSLKDLLKDTKEMKKISHIGNLEEYLQCMLGGYKDYSKVNIITRKILQLLQENRFNNGKSKSKMTAKDFITIMGCSLLLIEQLKLIHTDNKQLMDTNIALCNILAMLEYDECVSHISPCLSVNPSGEQPARNHFIKKLSDLNYYIEKHFIRNISQEGPLDRGLIRSANHRQENPKVFRTIGKNLNSLRIDHNKSLTLENTTGNIKTALVGNNIKETQNSVSLITNKIFANGENTSTFKNIVIDKPNDNDTDAKINIVSNEVDEFDVVKHGSTFGITDNGIKVIRNIELLESYEKKFKEKRSLNAEFNAIEYNDNTSNELITSNDISLNGLSSNSKINGISLNDSAFINDSIISVNEALKTRKNHNINKIVSKNKVHKKHISLLNNENYFSQVDDNLTDDSGYSNETYKQNPLKKCIYGLELTFSSVRKFIDNTVYEMKIEKLVQNRKNDINYKTARCEEQLGIIIDDLERIKQRESYEQYSNNLRIILAKEKNAFMYTTFSEYMENVEKCFKKAVLLRDILKLLSNIINYDCDGITSISSN